MGWNEQEWHPVIGCDIGNAYAFASVARGRKVDPISLMPDKIGNAGMPTVARISRSGEISVYPHNPGKAASEGGIVSTIKRKLDLDALPMLNTKRPVSPWEVYSAIARDLCRVANERTEKAELPPIYDVVFTYPAVLHRPDQRERLNAMQDSIESVELDGHHLHVVGRLPEPAAAAIQYLNYVQHVAPERARFHGKELNVLVYDLGHGTFDLALVTARDDITYELQLQDGDDSVGGVDFDGAIYDELCGRFYKENKFKPTTAHEQRLLRELAGQTKLDLCAAGIDSVPVKYDVVINDEEQSLETVLTRDRFEEISAPLLQRTLVKTDAMLSEAEKKGIRVDRIVLTGGASQMPMVRRKLQELVGDRYTIEEPYQPSKAVSFGAALYGAYIPAAPKKDLQPTAPTSVEGNGILRQRAQYHEGIMILQDNNTLKLNVMIKAGSKLPAISPEPLLTDAPPEGCFRFQIAFSEDGKATDFRRRYLDLFGLPTKGTLEITMRMDESLNLTIECKAPDGKVYSVGTGKDPHTGLLAKSANNN